MGGSDPKPFDVAESSPLRVLWIVLPLLAAFVACLYAQLYKAPASAPWIEVTLSPPWFRMGGSAAWSLLVIALLGIGLGMAFFRRRVELAGDVLDVRSTMYRRRVPVAQLRLDQAEVVEKAVGGFTSALFEAVVIVLIVSFISLLHFLRRRASSRVDPTPAGATAGRAGRRAPATVRRWRSGSGGSPGATPRRR